MVNCEAAMRVSLMHVAVAPRGDNNSAPRDHERLWLDRGAFDTAEHFVRERVRDIGSIVGSWVILRWWYAGEEWCDVRATRRMALYSGGARFARYHASHPRHTLRVVRVVFGESVKGTEHSPVQSLLASTTRGRQESLMILHQAACAGYPSSL